MDGIPNQRHTPECHQVRGVLTRDTVQNATRGEEGGGRAGTLATRRGEGGRVCALSKDDCHVYFVSLASRMQ